MKKTYISPATIVCATKASMFMTSIVVGKDQGEGETITGDAKGNGIWDSMTNDD